MRRMRRIALITALLLVLALAVPASAATWRTYATVRADDAVGASASTWASDVEDIQLGVYTYGRSGRVEWNGSWECGLGDGTQSRAKQGRVTTRPRTWRWVNLRTSSRRTDGCHISMLAYPIGKLGPYKLKVRVR